MNKEINYLIEFLAKSNIPDISDSYVLTLNFFDKHSIYIPSKYDTKALRLLAQKSDIVLSDDALALLKRLDLLLNANIPEEIKSSKKQLFETLVKSNFKQKKGRLDKVETAIYKTLSAYIFGLTRALDLFFIYTKQNMQEPEVFIDFAQMIHTNLFETIFNEEEKALLREKLKEIMSVYLSLYARYLYI
ncbi:MAG: hypothetical protein R3331_03465 [Sulfurospirillaceae bacterium]|nr:hypothetical protein [Sulfurospirillaceae bacterium]